MSKNDVLISVIIPVYDIENYLSMCLDSILNQTYQNLEILLIDDGSPDNSGKICDNYAKLDGRIRVFHKENGGVSSARKIGIENAQGEWVAFIDGDDYVERDYFEQLIKSLKDTEVDVVCCNCVDEGDTKQPNISIQRTEIIETFADKLRYYFEGVRFAYVIWGKIIKREVLNKIYMPDLRYTEDTHMMLQLFSICEKVSLVAYAGYHYRVQENSAMSKSKKINVVRDTLVTNEYLCKLCSQLGRRAEYNARKLMQKYIYIAILENCYSADTNHIELNKYYCLLPKRWHASLDFIKQRVVIVLYRINSNLLTTTIRSVRRQRE